MRLSIPKCIVLFKSHILSVSPLFAANGRPTCWHGGVIKQNRAIRAQRLGDGKMMSEGFGGEMLSWQLAYILSMEGRH